MTRSFRLTLLRLALACSFPLLNSCATTSERSDNPVFNTEKDPVIIGPAEERAIGLQAAAQVAKQSRKAEDPALQAYVTDLGRRLASQSRRADLAYTFTVLESPEVNAFALPGGFVYVTTGILRKLNNEAELAAVVGHEIGHVAHQHALKRLQRQVIAQTGLDLLLGLMSKNKAQFVAAFAGPAASLVFLRNGREAELESDEEGLNLCARLGYAPGSMVKVQEMLMKAHGRADPLFGDMLSTHPASEARIIQAKNLLPKYEGPVELGVERYAREVLSKLR